MNDPISLTIGLFSLFGGALCLLLAIPLLRGNVPRNALYGVRLRQSFASDQAWLAINRFGGRQLRYAGVAIALLGGIAIIVPMRTRPTLALIFAAAILLVVLILAIRCMRFARRYERENGVANG